MFGYLKKFLLIFFFFFIGGNVDFIGDNEKVWREMILEFFLMKKVLGFVKKCGKRLFDGVFL